MKRVSDVVNIVARTHKNAVRIRNDREGDKFLCVGIERASGGLIFCVARVSSRTDPVGSSIPLTHWAWRVLFRENRGSGYCCLTGLNIPVSRKTRNAINMIEIVVFSVWGPNWCV